MSYDSAALQDVVQALDDAHHCRSSAASVSPCSVADSRPASHGLAVAARYFTTDHYH
jgi:hypothetical protein